MLARISYEEETEVCVLHVSTEACVFVWIYFFIFCVCIYFCE